MLAFLYIFVFGVFAVVLARRPSLIIRPSVWVALGMLVQINAAAAFCGPQVDDGYENAFLLRMLAILFPVGVALWVFATPHLSVLSKRIYGNCRLAGTRDVRFGGLERGLLIVLGAMSAAVLTAYLATIPPMSTGLAAIVFDPENSAMARERGLKLLSNVWLAYGYSFHASCLAPILAALLLLMRPSGKLLNGLRYVVLALVVVSVALTGARAPAGCLLVALAVTYLLRKGIVRGSAIVLGAAFGALVLATLLSISREGRLADLTPELVGKYLQGGIARRTFVTPYQTGVWTNLYAAEHGLFGAGASRHLAMLAGKEFHNYPNLVALAYAPNTTATSSANTCFLFVFQASFGLWAGWLVALVALCLLDHLLHALLGTSPLATVAILAALLVSLLSLVSSALTVSLVTHGVLPITSIALIAGSIRVRRAYRQGARFGECAVPA